MPDATHIGVLHESLRPGDNCPACGRGRLFALNEPARFLRIVGQAPLVAVCWDCQRLRCSACGNPYTARAPDEAQGEKHSETAVAMMALLRYGGGMPLNRLESSSTISRRHCPPRRSGMSSTRGSARWSRFIAS